MKKQMTEKHFSYGIGILVSIIIGYMVLFGNVDKNTIIGMSGAIGFSTSILLAIGFSLQHFLKGTQYDVLYEIFENKNIPASIYASAIWIALAIVISKSLF